MMIDPETESELEEFLREATARLSDPSLEIRELALMCIENILTFRLLESM